VPQGKGGKPVRAISIRQPYVEQIFRGIKKCEFRSVPTNIRERVWIYASLKPGPAEAWNNLAKKPGDLPTGVILGTVEIVDCRATSRKLLDFAYVLKAPRRLRTPRRPVNQPQPVFWRPKFR
jgi:hypothetical protein